MDRLCQELELGLSIVQACEQVGLNDRRFHDWRAKGEEDEAAGVLTIYAEFRRRVAAAQGAGDRACWVTVQRGVELGAKARSSTVILKSADLALKALNQRRTGREGAEKRWGPMEPPAPSAEPLPGIDMEGLKRLSDEDLAELERILLKMRGAEGAG